MSAQEVMVDLPETHLGSICMHGGRFWWSSQGYNPQFYLRHSKNIKYQHIADGTSGHPHGSGQWYWVLEEPIDSAIVTGGADGNYKTNNSHSGTPLQSLMMSPLGGGGSGGQVQAFLPPAQSSPYGSGHYHFVIWDTSNAEQEVINKGDNYPLYDDGDYTISGFNYFNYFGNTVTP